MWKILKLTVLLVVALPAIAFAGDGDQELANEFIECTVIASFMSTVPKPSEANYQAAKRGWEQKALTLNGAARLLTSQEYAKQQSDVATDAFIQQTGADRELAIEIKFRRWMNKIDACDAKLQTNMDRLLKAAGPIVQLQKP